MSSESATAAQGPAAEISATSAAAAADTNQVAHPAPTGGEEGKVEEKNGSNVLPQSSEKPSDADLEAALKIEVQDKDGKKKSLGSLARGGSETPRVVVVFIRHFFCGLCQEYIRALHRQLPPSTLAGLSPATRLVVVGHGDAALIGKYAAATDCPYDIYAEPSRAAYDRLGFVSTLRRSAKPPAYFGRQSMLRNVLSSLRQNLAAGSKMLAGGKISQNGGELVFVDGRLGFFHRMANTTDHIEVEDLDKILRA